MRNREFALFAFSLFACSWPELEYAAAEQGCTSDMEVCLTMDEDPIAKGWTAMQGGNASFRILSDDFQENRTLQFESEGADIDPRPVAILSYTPVNGLDYGRFILEFRLAHIGPYTNFAPAEIDFGQRALRLFVLNVPMPERRALYAQLTQEDRRMVLWEREIPDQDFFQKPRHFQFEYWLAAGERRASLHVEGMLVEGAIPLEEDWPPAAPTLRIGVHHRDIPTSGAVFELDNVGFEG
jgi:hypothetical protein